MDIVGTLIEEKYEILMLLGKGGMSKVYLALDIRLKKKWAIKVIQKAAPDKYRELNLQSAKAEANLMKKFSHPALPRIVDILEDDKFLYVVMDYIDGISLNKLIEKNHQGISQDKVIEWAKQLCGVLNYLHSSVPPIIYRDMKPSNIIIKQDGYLSLIDFGIAREYKNQRNNDTVCLGTKGYAAPEQFAQNCQTDARTDIYSLGATLYHLLTGHSPYESPFSLTPIRFWNPGLSKGLENIIAKCTNIHPKNRFQNCNELLIALNDYQNFDNRYYQKSKRNIYIFILSIVFCIIFFLIGLVSQLWKNHLNTSNYSLNLELAETVTNSSEKISYYTSAMEIKPEKIESYLGLIQLYKMDGVLSKEEEAQLLKRINKNLTLLKNNKAYGTLAYELGKTYWYYYDYGDTPLYDNQITRVICAEKWFDDAVTYGNIEKYFMNTALVYRDIGKFNREVIINMEEATDEGIYQNYWENLKELLSLFSEHSKENDLVKLELYKFILYSIEDYAGEFKNDGITESEQQFLFERTKQDINQTKANSEKEKDIKNSLIIRFEDIQKAIDYVYIRREQ